MDAEGKQLMFTVKTDSDSSVFWKGTIRIICVKIDPSTDEVETYRVLNLNQFLKVSFIHGHGHTEVKFGGGIYPHIWSTVGDNIVFMYILVIPCTLVFYIHLLAVPPSFNQELKLKKSLPVV